VQCAGNRRQGLMEAYPIPGEMPWGAGAIGNARWTGVPLREVLLAAGVEEGARHVAFAGLDEIEEGWSPNYGSSIPVEKGMGPEVLLAYEMNDEPLRPEHGFPLRAVVPGYIGARSVKWLSGIALQDAPSDNYFQAQQYKLFPPYVTGEPDDPSEGVRAGRELGQRRHLPSVGRRDDTEWSRHLPGVRYSGRRTGHRTGRPVPRRGKNVGRGESLGGRRQPLGVELLGGHPGARSRPVPDRRPSYRLGRRYPAAGRPRDMERQGLRQQRLA
jgi:Oxidoreductase molybdopterin binding domain